MAQRSSGLIGMIFKLLDDRDQILQRFNTELRPILRPILWLRNRDRNEQAGIISVFNLVRDRKAAAPMHQMADDTECAAEQRVHWIPHRNFIGGGFVRLTSRDIPACLRSRAWIGGWCGRSSATRHSLLADMRRSDSMPVSAMAATAGL